MDDGRKIMVKTPQGIKFHGTIRNIKDKIVFWREVDYDKDRMRMFDAFSINPDAYKECGKIGVEYFILHDLKAKLNYVVTLSNLNKMLKGSIKDQNGKKLAWEAEFSGGKTIYIKISAFKLVQDDGKIVESIPGSPEQGKLL